MHGYKSRMEAQRRSIQPRSDSTRVMQMTVDSGAVTALRQLVMRVCGEALQFMRIAMCADGNRIRVWLCVSAAMVTVVMDAVLRGVPGGEFGTFRNGPPQERQ